MDMGIAVFVRGGVNVREKKKKSFHRYFCQKSVREAGKKFFPRASSSGGGVNRTNM